MYDLSELTDLIHGCPDAEDDDLRPRDPDDPADAAFIADIVYQIARSATPIGRLLARADLAVLGDLVIALAGLGMAFRDAGHDETVDAAILIRYGARLPAPVGPWLIRALVRQTADA